jgi:hypothetical protein
MEAEKVLQQGLGKLRKNINFLMTTFAFSSTCYLLYELTSLFDDRTVPGVSEGNHDTLDINIMN